MAARVLVAGCLIGAAVTIAVPGAGAGGRLRRLHARPRPSARPQPRQLARIGAGLGGLVTVLFLGGWSGVIAGCLVAVVLDRLLRRLESAAARAQRLHAAADLPVAADLLAAVLRGGAPADRAAALVAEALGGPLGERLARVARATLLGAPPEEAWGHLAVVTGSDRLIRAAVRSSHSGAALAGALTRVADDLRADRAVEAEAAAHRAGVFIVLPLGLCFLPAFVLAGLVPVIVAVLGDVL